MGREHVSRINITGVVTTVCLLFLPGLTGASTADQFRDCYSAYEAALAERDWDEALVQSRLCYEVSSELFATDHPNRAALTLNYARMLQRAQELDNARNRANEAWGYFRNIYGDRGLETIDILMLQGDIESSDQSARAARRHYDRALDIAGRHKDEFPDLESNLNLHAGRMLLNEAYSARAIDYIDAALTHFEAALGNDHHLTANARFHKGKYYHAAGDHADARPYLEQALAYYDATGEDWLQMRLTTHAFLVAVLEELGDSEAATEHSLAVARLQPVDRSDWSPLYRRVPNYPPTISTRGHATFRFSINSEGFVENIELVERQGSAAMANAAEEALQHWRYAPRMVNGRPVHTDGVMQSFVFEMRDLPTTGTHLRR